jgi:tetratricopeptide (TPR) repeat protein
MKNQKLKPIKTQHFFSALLILFFLSPAVTKVLSLPANALQVGRSAPEAGSSRLNDADDAQLSLAEMIRSSRPEKLFELLKSTKPVLPRDRELFMRGLAHYRAGDFENAEATVSRISRGSADAALLRSLLLASQGRFEEAEKDARSAFDRRSLLGPFFFEAGLHLSYVLQHLKRHRDAASVIEAIAPEAPLSRPVLRCIAASLNAAPAQPYDKRDQGGSAVVPLLSDGSIPPRTVMAIRAGQKPVFVLFDTGTSLTFLKTEQSYQGSCAMAMALDPNSNVDFHYGWESQLELANWSIQNVPVGFVPRESAGMQYEALFGLPLMRQFFVVFDFPKRAMQLLPRAPETTAGDCVSFRYVADQLIIPALIHNQRANLLLDTGLALPSLKLDTSWADKLSAPLGKKGGRGDAGKLTRKGAPAKTGALELSVKSLKFGRQELKDLPVAIEPLQRRLQQTPLAVRIDAILSAPLIKQYIVSIDFEKNRIYFK